VTKKYHIYIYEGSDMGSDIGSNAYKSTK